MMKVHIACGGTGGHLAPGIALAEGLRARGHEPRLLVSRKQIDSVLMGKYPHLPAVRIPAAPFGWRPATLARFVSQQAAGLRFAVGHLRTERPDVVLGFGGFTTASVVLAARVQRIPVALHEANRVPGRAVRLLARWAQRVYLPAGVKLSGVRWSVVRHQGLPVRAEFRRIPRAAAQEALGLKPAPRTLVVLGGSQGASALNDWATKSLEALALEGVQVVCVTGPGQTSERTDRVLRTRNGAEVRSVFLPFCDRMPELLACADLAVSRAGAGTLTELARCGVPAVLVPFPHAADNHQLANARHFEKQGGGLVVEQPHLGGLLKEVLDLAFNDWLLRKFRDNLHRIDQENSLDAMLDDLERIAAQPPQSAPAGVLLPV